MAKVMHLDLETYSDVDLFKHGVYAYAESPDFEILMIAYSVDGAPVTVIDLKNETHDGLDLIMMDFEMNLEDPEVIKTAWNANFERVCLANHFKRPMPPKQWSCDMVDATRVGLPASLQKCGEVLNIEKAKDISGKQLIRYFSVPCKPTKANGGRTRNLPSHDPEKWNAFLKYCARDVEAEMEIADKIKSFEVSDFEQGLWSLDQMINDRGILLDTDLVAGAVALDIKAKVEDTLRAKRLTGIDNPNSQQQLLKWFNDEGADIDNVRKDTIVDVYKHHSGKLKQMAALRLDLSKTSVKKYTKMDMMACDDGRVRGAFQFFGASKTGRWAGRGVQLQNLTKHKLSDTQLDIARQLIKEQDFDTLDIIFKESSQSLLSQLVRTAFIAPPGHSFYVSDFSAIEARVIAWYAQEKWRLQVFKTHGKIYEASASQMFSVPIEDITKDNPLRQKGKVSELALGYQGGPGALKAMGALEMGLHEDELQGLVDTWRESNPQIVQFWKALQTAAIELIQSREPQYTHGLKFYMKKGFMMIELPSGRSLAYPKPRLKQNRWGGQAIVFKGLDERNQWTDIDTYGGKLVENVVQATARDILGISMIRLHKKGYSIIGHVHDEVIIEAPEGQSIEVIEDIMGLPVEWAKDLPLAADGFVTPFYMKD